MVLGASHSGTTMLDLMLGNHPETFSTGEVCAYYRPYRKHHFYPVCGCGRAPCSIWKNLLNTPEHHFHISVANLPKINNVVDSSKDLSWAMDAMKWARESGINIHNVVIWKEPIELAYSYWKRGNSIAALRNDFLTYYERLLACNMPFISVRYRSLVSDPANVIKQLCETTGLPWQLQQDQFWLKQHHHLFGASATSQQARNGKSSIRSAADYPREFLDAIAGFILEIAKDQRLMRVIGALDSMDVEKTYVPKVSATAAQELLVRPLWYYRHAIKRIVYRHFPRDYQSAGIPVYQK
jgi:hypothetical protein